MRESEIVKKRGRTCRYRIGAMREVTRESEREDSKREEVKGDYAKGKATERDDAKRGYRD